MRRITPSRLYCAGSFGAAFAKLLWPLVLFYTVVWKLAPVRRYQSRPMQCFTWDIFFKFQRVYCMLGIFDSECLCHASLLQWKILCAQTNKINFAFRSSEWVSEHLLNGTSAHRSCRKKTDNQFRKPLLQRNDKRAVKVRVVSLKHFFRNDSVFRCKFAYFCCIKRRWR